MSTNQSKIESVIRSILEEKGSDAKDVLSKILFEKAIESIEEKRKLIYGEFDVQVHPSPLNVVGSDGVDVTSSAKPLYPWKVLSRKTRWYMDNLHQRNQENRNRIASLYQDN